MRLPAMAVVAAVALVAGACADSSSDDIAGAPGRATDTTTGVATTRPTTSRPDVPPTSSAALTTVFADYDGPRAIDTPFAVEFAGPLIDISLVISGGPPPDGIPPIDDPNFSEVDQAGFLQPTEPILVLEHNGEVRGFPVQIMTWHEIVNTEVGGEPVSITFCPLCNSATAFPRTLSDGTVVDFGTSGLLFNSSLLMYDRQTGSLWTHFDGRAVVGATVGETLTRLAVQTVSWATFRDSFPDALVLNRNTGYVKSYGMNPYAGYDSTTTSPFAFVGEIDDRLLPKTRVVAVRGEEETLVLETEQLAARSVVHTLLDGRQVVVLHQPGTSSALDSQFIFEGKDVGATGVFVSTVADDSLELVANGDGTFRDLRTGSTWDIFGRAVEGSLTGESLEAVEHLDTFWFAIAAFAPDATIIDLG